MRLDEQTALAARRVADLATIAGLAAGARDPRDRAPAGALAHAAGASLLGALVQRTFDLAEVPGPGDGPAGLPQWDSLGALRLLLAIEQEFQVRLDEGEMARIQSVAELGAAIERIRGRDVRG